LLRFDSRNHCGVCVTRLDAARPNGAFFIPNDTDRSSILRPSLMTAGNASSSHRTQNL
jgi:hypothetical protein